MSERVEVDFDQHSAAYADEPWEIASKLANESPVAWTERHGGFWVVSGYDAVREAARDGKTFSSRHDLPTGCTAFAGINIPPVAGRYLPIELDPPEQLDWRRGLATQFAPAMVNRLLPLMEEYCTWFIDRRIETGEIEFVMDFCSAVPAMVTLHLLGLPLKSWRTYVELTHKINYSVGQERDAVFGKFDLMMEDVTRVARQRRTDPRDDLLTVLGRMEVGGKTLGDEDIASACGTIIAGGIDTTSAVVVGALKHLGENPSDRDYLRENPAEMPRAVEEFLRFISPVTGLARTATRDVELGGQQIKAGDRVQLMWHGANMDEGIYHDADRIDLRRDASKHVTFGYGAHRCLGSAIARADIPKMLSKVLSRIPDYQLVAGGAVRYPSIGVSNNYIALPATFEPSRKVGVSDALHAELEGND